MDEFGIYELTDYIFSYDMAEQLKLEKEVVVQRMYDDCSPTTVQPNELGFLVPVYVDTEDMALAIIEQREIYDKKIQRYADKAKLFEQALDDLTAREKDVIFSYYFHKSGNDLGLSTEYYHELLRTAEKKLANSICELREEQQELIQLQEKEALKQRVQAWKQAN